jgi:signal transduction histidine kinase
MPAARLELRGNRHLLSRAIANLVENALKYTPPPGRIQISLTASDGAARLVVGDSGPGIPRESRDKVFDRFVRLETSRTTPGNGLGLSLARAVIRLHGGAVALEDNRPGLRVVVTLPLLPASPAAGELPPGRRRLIEAHGATPASAVRH